MSKKRNRNLNLLISLYGRRCMLCNKRLDKTGIIYCDSLSKYNKRFVSGAIVCSKCLKNMKYR